MKKNATKSSTKTTTSKVSNKKETLTMNINKESPPVHPIPAASSGVLRTDSHALRAGRRFENRKQY